MLARRLQLDPRALRETLHPEVREQPVGDSQFLPCVDSSAFAPQPLAVDQVGSGQIDSDPSSTESIDRLDIEVLSRLTVGQECCRAASAGLGDAVLDGVATSRAPRRR